MNDMSLGAGEVVWNGVRYRTMLSAAETGGTLGMVDTLSPPNSGPPRHIHHDADETFVLLTGETEFWVAGKTFVRGPGDTVFVPRGTEHTFRTRGEGPSRHLIAMTPGGFETFFAEMAAGAYRIPDHMDAISECAARHHLSFTGPPLGAG